MRYVWSLPCVSCFICHTGWMWFFHFNLTWWNKNFHFLCTKLVRRYSLVWKNRFMIGVTGFMYVNAFSSNTEINRGKTYFQFIQSQSGLISINKFLIAVSLGSLWIMCLLKRYSMLIMPPQSISNQSWWSILHAQLC